MQPQTTPSPNTDDDQPQLSGFSAGFSSTDSLSAASPKTTQVKGFDEQHPPDPEIIDACVHCGFCLSNCPSYRVLGTEMDSPRGRIYLMDGIHSGEIDFTPEVAQHFDTCLGCLACVSTCPSSVGYDQLLADMRSQVARNQPRSPWQKFIRGIVFNLFPYPRRLQYLMPSLRLFQKSGMSAFLRRTGLLERLSPQLASMEAVLPSLEARPGAEALPDLIPSQGETRFRVGMVLGCVQRVLFDDVNAATARVLSANGCEIVIPQAQGCCAALPFHQGEEEQAQHLARQMIDQFEDTRVDAIIINAAGCGHTLKDYGTILRDDPEYAAKGEAFSRKVKDIHEFLYRVGLTAPLSPLQGGDDTLDVVYQDACHLLHGQQIAAAPRSLLREIPDVEIKQPRDPALCCGSAGVYNILQPEVGNELGQMKVKNLLDTGAAAIASPNPGCALQIMKHLPEDKAIPVFHPIQLLDWSIRGKQLGDRNHNS